MNNFVKHLRTVLTHKKYVFEMCVKCGIPFRGVVHDLSKFSPTEFFESVKYYDGTKSPIVVCKQDKGYSKAWFHHRGRNSHHWEYWYDDFCEGGVPKLMPFEDALEMFCDFIGAGKAYYKDSFTYLKEYEWWLTKREEVIMHPVVWYFINELLSSCARDSKIVENLSFRYCYQVYFKYLVRFREGNLEGKYNSVIKN